jgi:hypothetical protein
VAKLRVWPLDCYWDRLDARGVFWGVLVAFVIGVPLFVYGNIVDKPAWIVGASLFIIAVSTAFCLLFPKRNPAVLKQIGLT